MSVAQTASAVQRRSARVYELVYFCLCRNRKTEKKERTRPQNDKRWGGEDERRRGEGGGRYLSTVWPLAAQKPWVQKFFFLERRVSRTRSGFGLEEHSTRPRLDMHMCSPESLDAYWSIVRCWEQKLSFGGQVPWHFTEDAIFTLWAVFTPA